MGCALVCTWRCLRHWPPVIPRHQQLTSVASSNASKTKCQTNRTPIRSTTTGRSTDASTCPYAYFDNDKQHQGGKQLLLYCSDICLYFVKSNQPILNCDRAVRIATCQFPFGDPRRSPGSCRRCARSQRPLGGLPAGGHRYSCLRGAGNVVGAV